MSVYYGDNPPRYERTETDYQRTPAHCFIRENIFINKKTYQGQDDTTTRGRSIGVVVKITKISRLPLLNVHHSNIVAGTVSSSH